MQGNHKSQPELFVQIDDLPPFLGPFSKRVFMLISPQIH